MIRRFKRVVGSSGHEEREITQTLSGPKNNFTSNTGYSRDDPDLANVTLVPVPVTKS